MAMIERLKELRRLWGWTQAFVADMLRVSRSSVSRWERGASSPRRVNEEKLDALVTSLEQASRGDEPPRVTIQTEGDAVAGDKQVGRDEVHGDVITTSDGTTYVIRDSLVVIVADPAMLEKLLGSQPSPR
jgi:transcriptional regulator with XRE-family HTH domain